MLAVTAPDPLCAICRGTGRARVRAEGSPRQGVYPTVVWARLIPATVAVNVEDSAEPRSGDRAVTCPSCQETERAALALLEGKTIAADQGRRGGR